MSRWKRFTTAWRDGGDPVLDHVRTLGFVFFLLIVIASLSVALTYFCYWIYTLFGGGPVE